MIIRRVKQLLLYRVDQIDVFWKIILCLLIIVEMVFLFKIHKKRYFQRAIIICFFVTYLLLVLSSTVFSRKIISTDYSNQMISFDVFTAWRVGPGIYGPIDTYTELILNIIIFIPFGYLLSELLKGKKIIFVFFACLAITVSIETLQLFTKRGFFELADILLNMTGACMGCIIYKIILLIRKHKTS